MNKEDKHLLYQLIYNELQKVNRKTPVEYVKSLERLELKYKL